MGSLSRYRRRSSERASTEGYRRDGSFRSAISRIVSKSPESRRLSCSGLPSRVRLTSSAVSPCPRASSVRPTAVLGFSGSSSDTARSTSKVCRVLNR